MKTKEYKPITTAQIKKIHTLLGQRGLLDEKRTLIHSFSNGRTDSTKELTIDEAGQMINYLMGTNGDTEKRKEMYRVIYGLAFSMDIIYGDTDDDYHMNVAKLNVFCRERGTVKKNLTEQSLTELNKTHRQFRAMLKKHLDKQKKQRETSRDTSLC